MQSRSFLFCDEITRCGFTRCKNTGMNCFGTSLSGERSAATLVCSAAAIYDENCLISFDIQGTYKTTSCDIYSERSFLTCSVRVASRTRYRCSVRAASHFLLRGALSHRGRHAFVSTATTPSTPTGDSGLRKPHIARLSRR